MRQLFNEKHYQRNFKDDYTRTISMNWDKLLDWEDSGLTEVEEYWF